jgi:Flp pilus assembly pilin Flp
MVRAQPRSSVKLELGAIDAPEESEMNFVKNALRNREGQGITEYIIIVVLIALIVIFAINRYGRMAYNITQNSTSTMGQQLVITDLSN